MIFFTSDLHIGHKNILTYCNRPFETLEAMHDYIIKQWNSQVSKDDTVYVLGDFSLNPKWSGIIIPQLNGTKILISGNHDATYPHHWNKKYDKMLARYKVDGWSEIHTEITVNIGNKGYLVLLSHFPYNDERFPQQAPTDNNLFLLHGHLHRRYIKNNNMVDVGFDAGLVLHSEDDIVKLIDDERQYIPSSLTDFFIQRDKEREDES